MLDQIQIDKLEVPAKIGVYDHEKGITQTLFITLTVYFDASSAMNSDDLSDTIDYDKLVSSIQTTCLREHTELIEALANKILRDLFLVIQVPKIKLTISKPTAIPTAKNTSFTITREQQPHDNA